MNAAVEDVTTTQVVTDSGTVLAVEMVNSESSDQPGCS